MNTKIPINGIKTILAISATLALAGCGGDDGDDDPAPSPTPDPGVVIEFPQQASAPSIETLEETGRLFISDDQLSLYFFDNDTQGQSNCNGIAGDEPGETSDPDSCAGRWPPLLAPAGTQSSGDFSTITRDDGTLQWAFRDYPLYTFIDDVNPGDTNGDGLGGVWHLARPLPVAIAELDGVPTLVGDGAVLTANNNEGVFETIRSPSGYDGLTLYTFDVDPLEEASCYNLNNGGCIGAWPPLLADPGARPFGLFAVIDVEGQLFQQWTYNGKALYFFTNDEAPGDTNGQGINDVWWIATEEAAIFRNLEGFESPVLSAVGFVEVLEPANEGDTENFVRVTRDKDQFTLYTFDNDTEFTSNCSGECLVAWPPLLADAQAADIGLLEKFDRGDGNLQWAYNGRPLYFYIDDTEPKTTNGDGVGGVWHVVHPLAVTNIVAEDENLGETLTVEGEVYILIDEVAVNQDKTGFQLYTFDNDTAESSQCSGACAEAWPALLATDDDVAEAPFSIFTREEDGLRQWAVNGYPLYFFADDTSAEDANGEGAGGLWWAARPAPVRIFEHESEGAMLVARGFNVLDSQGMTAEQLQNLTLYTFDNDTEANVSTCFDNCAVTWPPLYANNETEGLGSFVAIPRNEDGTTVYQWAYKGKPLYFFNLDSELGDTGGLYGSWPLARP